MLFPVDTSGSDVQNTYIILAVIPSIFMNLFYYFIFEEFTWSHFLDYLFLPSQTISLLVNRQKINLHYQSKPPKDLQKENFLNVKLFRPLGEPARDQHDWSA